MMSIITTCGNGSAAFSGDGGPATAASLNFPFGVAVALSGTVYIADSSNNRIRQVSGGGIVTTLAGNGIAAFGGDGGPASASSLNYPLGVAVSSAGTVYIADFYNNRVRQVPINGIITTFAGSGSKGFSGDGRAATSALLYYPSGVAVSSSGVVYIADWSNNRIRQVSVSGIISTLAGTSSSGYNGDGIPSTSATLFGPTGVAVASSGIVFIADTDNNRVRQVSNGIITTFSGTNSQGSGGDGGPASHASLYWPQGVAVSSSGIVYIADSNNNRVRQVTADGIISTLTGGGPDAYSGDGGPSTIASLNGPIGVAVSTSGLVYVADTSNNRVRMVLPSGSYVPDGLNLYPCLAGTWGAGVTANCSGPCSQGYFCTAGSLYATQYPCPAGTYGATTGLSTNFCSGLCAAGTFGIAGQSTNSCSGLCQQGYYCPAGSTTAGQVPCPIGTYGGSNGLSTIACSGLCFAGYFGNAPAQTTSACSGSCQQGHYCPAGSTSAMQLPCPAGRYGGSSGLGSSDCSGPCPTGAYCPINTTSPLLCPAGTYNSLPGALSVADCNACPSGTFNAALGATFSGCIPCGAGTSNPANGSDSSTACESCTPGYFSGLNGAHICTMCIPGFFSSVFAATSCSSCSAGTYQPISGANSSSACLACPAGKSTYTGGNPDPSACILVPYQCQPGTQPTSLLTASISDCVPLVCPLPLVPAPSNVACAGCAAGSSGSLGQCTACSLNSFCPGFTSVELHNPVSWSALIDARAPSQAPAACAALSLQLPLLLGTQQSSVGSPSTFDLVSSEVAVAATATSLAACVLLLWLFITTRQRHLIRTASTASTGGGSATAVDPDCSAFTFWTRLASCLTLFDAFALQHAVPDKKFVRKVATPLGGACTVIGILALCSAWTVLILQRQVDNVLSQAAVQGLGQETLASAASIPVAQGATMTGVRLLLAAEGERGACASVNWTQSGLVAGNFTLSTLTCGAAQLSGSELVLHTFACPTCLVAASSEIVISLPWSCQSLVLWLGTSSPAVGVVSSAHVTLASAVGGLVSSWGVPLMLLLQTDTASGTTSRGYSVLQGTLDISRNTADTLQPLSAAVRITVDLSPPALYQSVTLTERVTLLQLLASLAGLTGIFALFGVAFRYVEAELTNPRCPRPQGSVHGSIRPATALDAPPSPSSPQVRLRIAGHGGPAGNGGRASLLGGPVTAASATHIARTSTAWQLSFASVPLPTGGTRTSMFRGGPPRPRKSNADSSSSSTRRSEELEQEMQHSHN